MRGMDGKALGSTVLLFPVDIGYREARATGTTISLSFASLKERQIQRCHVPGEYPIWERGKAASDGFTDEHLAALRKGVSTVTYSKEKLRAEGYQWRVDRPREHCH